MIRTFSIEIDGERVDIGLRAATPGDESFVFSSWLKSYRQADEPRKMGNDVYFRGQHAEIEKILRKPETAIVVACAVEAPEVIFGWACGERQPERLVLHYVYVKPAPYRLKGVARQLIAQLDPPAGKQVVCTHHTYVLDKVEKAYPVTFNPYAARV